MEQKNSKSPMMVKLLNITGNPEVLIEGAARVCYDSFEKMNPPESTIKIIEHLIKSGHESVLEHASATFHVKGVSRALTHQLVRHRVASYSQRSQRYVKEKEPQYVTPPEAEKDGLIKAKFESAMKFAWDRYNELLELGLKGEDARFVLPNACQSEIVITMNFRELRHFLKLRTSKKAQWEIRDMAKRMHDILITLAPNCFKDIVFEEVK